MKLCYSRERNLYKQAEDSSHWVSLRGLSSVCCKESIMKALGHPAARACDGQRYCMGLSICLRVTLLKLSYPSVLQSLFWKICCRSADVLARSIKGKCGVRGRMLYIRRWWKLRQEELFFNFHSYSNTGGRL